MNHQLNTPDEVVHTVQTFKPSFIPSLVIALALIVVAYMGYSAATMFARNQAVDGCMTQATSLTQGDFVVPIYKSCMTDKSFAISK